MNTQPVNENEQAKTWNGHAGHAWVEMQSSLDRLFQPFEEMLVQAAAARPPRRVLDVGCGAGATTLALARRLGSGAHCLGIDISEPMLATARLRARQEGSHAEFLRANAETHPFEPATFDRIVSRFGVMFFDDSTEAFANLRRAATPDAELHLITWRSAADNPFMTTAERAAALLLPGLPARKPGAPGQFAFAAPNHVRGILTASGWDAIDIQPIDVTCAMPESDLVPYISRLGPVGLALQDAAEPLRAQVVETARAAFAPYVHGPEVRFTAACWMVTAHASSPPPR